MEEFQHKTMKPEVSQSYSRTSSGLSEAFSHKESVELKIELKRLTGRGLSIAENPAGGGLGDH